METTIEILKLLTHAGAIAVLIVIVIKLNGLLDGLNNIHNGLSPLSELEIINEKLNCFYELDLIITPNLDESNIFQNKNDKLHKFWFVKYRHNTKAYPNAHFITSE
uniref:Uncharacterized protein n=1 Tax=Rhizophagus irregularis (strain DAOM 181602 / DAOM 197198 / MUCL 43194) TaxID=747089 RepID=U9URC9_RHIID